MLGVSRLKKAQTSGVRGDNFKKLGEKIHFNTKSFFLHGDRGNLLDAVKGGGGGEVACPKSCQKGTRGNLKEKTQKISENRK